MTKKNFTKLSVISLFILLVLLNFLPLSYKTMAARINGKHEEKTLAIINSTGQDPQNPPSDAPKVETDETIAAKYGSLDKIPVHKEHSAVRIVDANGQEAKIECLDCHGPADNATGKEAVKYINTTACEVCHIEDNDARQKYKAPAIPTGRETLSEYSHTAHVDPIGRLRSDGQRQDCTYCHNPNKAIATMPRHSECYSCHSGPKAAKPIFNGQTQECLGCHSEEKIDRNIITPKEGRAVTPLVVSAHASYRDVNIVNHAAHLREPNNKPISCLECHASMLTKSSIDQFAQLPTMNDCSSCHANLKRAAAPNQMENCQLCHREVTTGLLPFTTLFDDNKNIVRSSSDRSLPVDHTVAFRINHVDQARQVNNKCSSCHIGVEKTGQENCASCHNIMRPRSHITIPRFKNIDHGRFAAMSRSNCVVCHSTEYCARCHTQLPRDHQPLGIFAGGSHRFQARANMRACLTCHTFEGTCQPCHVADANGPLSIRLNSTTIDNMKIKAPPFIKGSTIPRLPSAPKK